jgi:hypothetical protein
MRRLGTEYFQRVEIQIGPCKPAHADFLDSARQVSANATYRESASVPCSCRDSSALKFEVGGVAMSDLIAVRCRPP